MIRKALPKFMKILSRENLEPYSTHSGLSHDAVSICLVRLFSVILSHQWPARRLKLVEQGVTIFTIHKLNDLNTEKIVAQRWLLFEGNNRVRWQLRITERERERVDEGWSVTPNSILPKIGLAGQILTENFANIGPLNHFCCQNQSGQTNFGSQNWSPLPFWSHCKIYTCNNLAIAS